ncbi:MAG: flagellar biosynthetic protein FliQ [Planctomycetaceae bacterium]|nr:flagellar biosynthetic protein FliQ [Planctomycetaceae bacterium]
MDPQQAIDLGREAMSTALLVSAPLLLVGIAAGLIIGLLQALTQIQDQTLSFVPKILAMLVAFAIGLPWIVQRMVEYSGALISNIPHVVLGG